MYKLHIIVPRMFKFFFKIVLDGKRFVALLFNTEILSMFFFYIIYEYYTKKTNKIINI